jgi:hypothetical protein
MDWTRALVPPLGERAEQGVGQPGAGKVQCHRTVGKAKAALHESLAFYGEAVLAPSCRIERRKRRPGEAISH